MRSVVVGKGLKWSPVVLLLVGMRSLLGLSLAFNFIIQDSSLSCWFWPFFSFRWMMGFGHVIWIFFRFETSCRFRYLFSFHLGDADLWQEREFIYLVETTWQSSKLELLTLQTKGDRETERQRSSQERRRNG